MSNEPTERDVEALAAAEGQAEGKEVIAPSDDRRRARVSERYWLTAKGWKAAEAAENQVSRPAEVQPQSCSSCGSNASHHVEYVRKHGVCVT